MAAVDPIAVIEELLEGEWEVAHRKKGKSRPKRDVKFEVELKNAFGVLEEAPGICASVLGSSRRCYKGGGGAQGDEEEERLRVGGAREDMQIVASEQAEVKAQAVQVKTGAQRQYSLQRFFKVQQGKSVEGELPVLVKAGFRPDQVASKAIPLAPDAIVEAVAEDKAEILKAVVQREANRIAVYGADGGKAGAFGGRPRIAVEDRRGTANCTDRSNRLYPGQDRRRNDIDVVEALKICEFLQAQVPRFASEDQYWRAMVMRFRPRSKVQLQSLLSRKHVFEQRVRDLKLGGKRGSSGRMKGSSEVLHRRKDTVGVRAKGGGRKGDFREQKDQLKVWVANERAHGHALNMSDLWTQFKFLMEEEERKELHNEFQAKDEETRMKAALRKQEFRSRIQKIQASREYLKSFKRALMDHCEVKLLKPQRLVRLSLKEEEVRCELTWQMLDEAIWKVAFGGPEDLKDLVLDYKAFDSFRRDCVLGFSDQVPWRGKLRGGQQQYLETERPQRSKVPGGSTAVVQDNEGMNQTRGQESENADKFRVTVEMRQVIYNYFKDEDPVGAMGPTLLVVGGIHCRLSNISLDGRWKANERFCYDGKEVFRQAGCKCPGALMKTWRELRVKAPHLFEGIEVMQQPAAVVDTVINQWALEDLGSRYPVSIWQRDMLAATRSAKAKATMQVINQIEANIMGKMTPVLQLTDTDFARQLKAISEEIKDEVRQELKLKALQEKVPASYKCFAYEVLKILQGSLKKLQVQTDKDLSVLKAARRNGMLAYRPDFEKMQLVRADSQSWAAGMPEGSHRIKSSWLDSRYAWLDTSGRPKSPDFEQMEVAKSLADMEEIEYCNQEATRIGGVLYEQVALDLGEVDLDKDDKEAVEDMAYKQTHPSLRALYRNLDPLLSTQGKAEVKGKAEGKKRIREASAAALAKIKKKLKVDAKGLSRFDLLQRIVPVAGKRPGASKKGKKGKPSFKDLLFSPAHPQSLLINPLF